MQKYILKKKKNLQDVVFLVESFVGIQQRNKSLYIPSDIF